MPYLNFGVGVIGSQLGSGGLAFLSVPDCEDEVG